MRVVHPLGLVSRDELETVLYAVKAHQAHLESTDDFVGREAGIWEWFARMEAVIEQALADGPVDRCELDWLIEEALEIGSVRVADQGRDDYAEKREHLIELLTKLTTATTEDDSEPIDGDEIEVLLYEQTEIHDQYGNRVPLHMSALRISIRHVLLQWREDPSQLTIEDLIGVEAETRANHVWWVQSHGEDPVAGARTQFLTLFRRMRYTLERDPAPPPPPPPTSATPPRHRKQQHDGWVYDTLANSSPARPPPSWPRGWRTTERLLTLEEAAEILRKSPRTVRRWIHDGELTGIKVGQTWRIAETALTQLVSPDRIQSWLSNRKGNDGLATAETGDSETAEGRELVRDHAVGGALSDAGRKAQERWHLQAGEGRGEGDQEGDGRPRGWA